jgi:predicted SnoaL-like aldol condensation-catalyzing enzyme
VGFAKEGVADLEHQRQSSVSNLHCFGLSALEEKLMSPKTEEKNKSLVLEAFDALFNKRDFVEATRFWAEEYIQHSAHIPPGREGLFELVRNSPPEMRYENGTILAEGDLLMLHGRFSGIGAPANWIVLDIVRLEDGRLKEHWDVIEDEATRASSRSGLPMFGPKFPDEAPAR